MIETINALENLDRNYLSDLNMYEFYNTVHNDKKMIDNLINTYNKKVNEIPPSVAGVLARDLAIDYLHEFVELNKSLENINVMKLTTKFADILGQYNEMDDDLDIEIKSGIKIIKDALSSNEFGKLLLNKSIEIEKERLDLFLKEHYRREAISKIYPIKIPAIEIKNKDAKNILDNINYYINQYHELPKESEKTPIERSLIEEVKNLLSTAEHINDNEKYLIWQLAFLFLGDTTLMRYLYESTLKLVENSYLKEKIEEIYNLSLLGLSPSP